MSTYITRLLNSWVGVEGTQPVEPVSPVYKLVVFTKRPKDDVLKHLKVYIISI